MKFDNTIYEYLAGNRFSNGLDIDFSTEKFISKSRIEYIIDICKNKNVIHLGCADHLPLIDKKIKEGKWLHKLLLENTQHCIGIDNNQEAVDYIKNQLKINPIYCLDITADTPKLPDNVKWDYLLLGEMIEHVDNPVDFLQTIRLKFAKHCEKIIVTAPNVFCLSTIDDIKHNKENINTNHRYWFSPFTLSKIILLSGYKNLDISFSEQLPLPIIPKIRKGLLRFFDKRIKLNANFFSTIAVTAEL